MNVPPAFTVNREFPVAPPADFRIGRHYLLYARAGSMRLEQGGRQWSLPPARAALIAADVPIRVTIAHPLLACSVLFDAQRFAAPPAKLAVFEMTALARELVLACRDFGDDAVHPPIAEQLFTTLAAVTWTLSERQSPAVLPVGRSAAVQRALAFTEAHLDEALNFDDVAAAATVTPRSLSRRFADELGLPWGQALRRMRMIKAGEDLAMTGAQVTGIALSVGYSSVSAFNAAFREFSGKSPTAYRDDIRDRAF
ncbi:AraC family transcriptional regulator [Tabrizicola sp.]|uniref:helix-turn-helix transcriptional regulator n=1 Tax=Tabrizicola sp. TaxID=2005166 RepID=UPI00286B7470|nr:AraC family transcriptional regulator [Tabrizicola sp.]